MKPKTKSTLKLVAWISGVTLMSAFINWLIGSNTTDWYATLNRSALTPPNVAFGIVWSILSPMLALTGWYIWEADKKPELKKIKNIFISLLLLNWTWPITFFDEQKTGLALLKILAITSAAGQIIVRSYKKLPTVSFLLTPYFLWVSFASYLNFYIWYYN